jgi:putative ABC transport system substrate-binding protein
MKKNILAISVIINAVLLFVAVPKIIDMFYGQTCNSNEMMRSAGKATVSRIAILTPVTHPSLEQIERGFVDTLTKLGKHTYQCDVFNANGNKTLLRAQAEEIVQKDYDLIFTIATQPSQLIKEICTKKGKTTPLIFGAAEEPERLGLVQSLAHPGGNMTGVIDGSEYFQNSVEHIDLLLTLKPSVKNVLLVYNPGQNSGLGRKKEEYQKILTERGITLRTVEIFGVNEVYAKLSATIAGADVVLVLKDNTVVPAIDGVIKLCTMHHVTLLTSDLDSGNSGAALSFGVYEDQFGVQGAHLAMKILEDGADTATLSCVAAGDFKLKINTKTMAEQALNISKELLLLLKAVVVI